MGAFEQLFGPVRGEFEQKFSKNSNARGVALGGMLKLRFDWYITTMIYAAAINFTFYMCLISLKFLYHTKWTYFIYLFIYLLTRGLFLIKL